MQISSPSPFQVQYADDNQIGKHKNGSNNYHYPAINRFGNGRNNCVIVEASGKQLFMSNFPSVWWIRPLVQRKYVAIWSTNGFVTMG